MPKITLDEQDHEEERRILEIFDPAKTLPDCSNLVGQAEWDRALEYFRHRLKQDVKRWQVVKAVTAFVPVDVAELSSSLLEWGKRIPEDDWMDDLLEKLPREESGLDSAIAGIWFRVVRKAEEEALGLVPA